MIGAQGNRALRNVIAVGDGWMPVNYSPAELAAYLDRLRNMCAAAGRTSTASRSRSCVLPKAIAAVGTRIWSGGRSSHPADLGRLVAVARTAERELEDLARGFLD